jgi:hypothetical protein
VLIAARQGAPRFYDEGDYDHLARALAAGGDYALRGGPSAFRPPGWPLVLSAIYRCFGAHPIAGEIVQSLLFGLAIVAVARLARLVSGRPAVAMWAATAAALHPALAYASATLYPTTLTATALTIGLERLASAWYARRGRAIAPALIGGALLGLAGLATTYFALLPVLFAAHALARRKVAVAFVVAIVGTAPSALWLARNAIVLGVPSLSTSVGFNLAIGANDDATPRSGNWVEPTLTGADADADEPTRDRIWRARAHAWIAAHPARYAALAVGRAFATLDSAGSPKTRGPHDGVAARAIAAAMLPWTLLGVAGAIASRRRIAARLALAALLLVAASSAASIAKPRFRFPVDPTLGVFASLLVVTSAARLRVTPPFAARSACPR